MNHTLSPGQPRDHLFDNIKALMLFLVPLGHTLDVFIADGNVEEILMKYIYLFHMPIFAFVTGYFTKNLDKARENAVKKCLIPYLVFQGLYILMAVAMLRLGLAQFNAGTFNASILLPSSAFYYLLAVFFWKLLGILPPSAGSVRGAGAAHQLHKLSGFSRGAWRRLFPAPVLCAGCALHQRDGRTHSEDPQVRGRAHSAGRHPARSVPALLHPQRPHDLWLRRLQ